MGDGWLPSSTIDHRCLLCLTDLPPPPCAPHPTTRRQDADYAIEIAKVNVPLKGGLGIGLEELRRGRDGPWCTYLTDVTTM